MVGASYSSVTKPLSKATLAMRLPLISYAATNRDLSRHKGGLITITRHAPDDGAAVADVREDGLV